MTPRLILSVLVLTTLLTGCASYETKAPCGRVLAYAPLGDACGPMQPVNVPFEHLIVEPGAAGPAVASSDAE